MENQLVPEKKWKTLAGSLSNSFELLVAVGIPNIHIHMLTTDEERAYLGHYKSEICCHGCGTSILMLHKETDSMDVFDSKHKFLQEHGKCPNFGFDIWCPDVRRSTTVLDYTLTPQKSSGKSSSAPRVIRGTS